MNLNNNHAQTIDGFRPRPRQAVAQPQRRLPSRPITATHRAFVKPKVAAKPRRKVPHWFQVLLLMIGALVISLFAQSAIFGQLMILLYGVVAFWGSIASRNTFILAALSIVATIILLVGKGDVGMAQNFATYTFLFLVVGVFTLSRELKKEGGRIYSRRQKKQS